MTTIRDVAAKAQVSVSTVSHVINGTRFVENETRARVQAAIAELGYRPNSLARSLRRRVTGTIGLLVPDNANPFFADMARLIEDVGFDEGYSVILCNSDGSDKKESAYIDVLRSKQVDGLLIISSSNHPEFLRSAVGVEVPVVVVDRALEEWPVDQVMVDNELGGYQAGHYLAGLGHRRIVCIAGPSSATPSAGRSAGFKRALSEFGIRLSESAILPGDFQYSGGESAMRILLEQMPDLTAVFATNDLMAIGAMNVLQRAGRRIPDDVSVIGFDNVPQSAAMFPALTTIAQPTEQLARTSISLLLKRINGSGDPAARILLPTHLIERESCKYI
ncbi:MAG: LacI family DNA-binding transcriptional regulator [Chloroflexi bacterium]|nr:LacI family DNA-binding transcriptional regulator [Chloroflexota bacterium]